MRFYVCCLFPRVRFNEMGDLILTNFFIYSFWSSQSYMWGLHLITTSSLIIIIVKIRIVTDGVKESIKSVKSISE